MAKKLIITEKPSVARDFARVLGVSGNRNGYIENDNYVVSWCFGHLVQMVYPEEYDAKYESWKLEDLPFLPTTYKYGVVESAKDQYKIVNSLLHREDIDTVYWAGDSGKEGQTIEENIRNYGGVREGMTELRVWIDSQTDDEIRRGIAEARPMSDYARLGKSGIMRTIEDYSLGINFSRVLSIKYGKMINDAAATTNYTAIAIGRVMTCVLGMVVNREREIRNFTETPFYRIVGSFSDINFSGEWKAIEGSRYYESPLLYKENGFKKKEDAEHLIDEVSGKDAVVEKCETGVNKKKAPLLFNLAELQSECSKIFKISPAETLQIVQDLYERKLTTYPRTDARVLSSAIAKEISKNIYPLRNYEPLSKFASYVVDNKKFIGIEKSMYTDDSKVTDHYAIIPTGQTGAISGLDDIHRKVYELIAKRFLAIFYPPAEYRFIKIELRIDREHFYTSAKVLKNPGYMEVTGIPANKEDSGDGEESDAKAELITLADSLSTGDTLEVKSFEIKDGKTSPPKRYTGGNLILAMENAGNLIEDEELRQQIKNIGIGTSATRGEILEKLERIHYLERNKKTQIITPGKIGEMIYEVVVLTTPSLLNPEMSASWEKGLEGITNGTVDDVEYRRKLEDYIRRETLKMAQYDLTEQIASNIYCFTDKDSKGIATRKRLGIKCPACGGELTTTQFGYGCTNYRTEGINCKFSLGQICGVDIPEDEFVKLISEGRTSIIEGFKSKAKKSFKASLVLNKKEDAAPEVVFDFEGVGPEYIEGMVCPDCGGRIYERGGFFICENNVKDNPASCNFFVGQIAQKQITPDILKELLTEGRTQVVQGFKGKNGNKFDACLVLKKNEAGKSEIILDFDGISPKYIEDVVCPDCGGRIYERAGFFICEKNERDNPESCRFFIGKVAQKQLTAANVKELLSEKKTKTIRGFKGKSGNKFDACLVLKTNEEGKSEISFDFEDVEAKTVKGVNCPLCGGEIAKTRFGYGCVNYNRNDPENSCRFSIGTILGIKLNDTQIKALFADGITPLISGFKSKTGNKFDAKLAWSKDEETGKITGTRFVFDDEAVQIKDVVCPKCGGKIIKGRLGFRCEHYSREDEGCKFFIGKIAGVMLDDEQVIKLLQNKRSDVITGFLSRSGNTFDTDLVLDDTGNVVFGFSVENKAVNTNENNKIEEEQENGGNN